MASFEEAASVMKIDVDTRRPGSVAIKKEFLLTIEKDADPIDERPVKVDDRDSNSGNGKKKFRGMDRKRKQKMFQARNEVSQNEVRLCHSILVPGKICKYGEKCSAEHSIESYMKLKDPDIGENCVNFDAQGYCQYGVSCRFANAHTNEDFSQKKKDPAPNYKPTINAESMAFQTSIRRREYDFGPAEEAAKKVITLTNEQPLGSMEREKLKLDMRSLKGKRYLAPLTTVGNLPFRRLCVELGAEVTCGEMALATSFLTANGPSEWPLLKRHPSEKMFGVQLCGGYSDTLGKISQLISKEMEVDFIDLNLGCPIDMVNEKGGGCTLATRTTKLIQVVKTMQHVMGDIPLSLKMRYGVKTDEKVAHLTMEKIVKFCPPQLIQLHPRSKEQRYTKEAAWDYVPTCVKALNGKVPLWVCGDVFGYQDYYNRLENNEIDGITIGRGALIKPWIFTEIAEKRDWDISATERLDIVKKFCDFGLEHWGSDNSGVEKTRRFLLEWTSFHHRYVPLGLLETLPAKMNEKPPPYFGRSDLETLLGSKKASDWVKITEMFLGKTPEGFLFVPKHRANAY